MDDAYPVVFGQNRPPIGDRWASLAYTTGETAQYDRVDSDFFERTDDEPGRPGGPTPAQILGLRDDSEGLRPAPAQAASRAKSGS